MDKRNTAFIGKGVSINKYTGARGKSGSNDANAEFLQEIRRIFDDNHVLWQMGELGKVDQGVAEPSPTFLPTGELKWWIAACPCSPCTPPLNWPPKPTAT